MKRGRTVMRGGAKKERKRRSAKHAVQCRKGRAGKSGKYAGNAVQENMFVPVQAESRMYRHTSGLKRVCACDRKQETAGKKTSGFSAPEETVRPQVSAQHCNKQRRAEQKECAGIQV